MFTSAKKRERAEEGKKKRRHTKQQQTKEMVEVLHEGGVTWQVAYIECNAVNADTQAHTHTRKGTQNARTAHTWNDTGNRTCSRDTNGLWLEVLAKKHQAQMETTSAIWFCSGNAGQGPDGIPLSAENKQDIFHLYYFRQLKREESLPTMWNGKHSEQRRGRGRCHFSRIKHAEPQVSEILHGRWQRASQRRKQAGYKNMCMKINVIHCKFCDVF